MQRRPPRISRTRGCRCIAQLVDDYIQLRNLDHESDILDQTVRRTRARSV